MYIYLPIFYIYIKSCLNTIVFNSEPWSIIYISGSVCFNLMFLLILWDFIKYVFIILNPTPLFPTPSLLHVPFFIFVSSLCFCLWSLFMFFWKFFLISIFLLELFFSKNGRTTLFFIKLPLCSRTISNNTVKTTNMYWCFSWVCTSCQPITVSCPVCIYL